MRIGKSLRKCGGCLEYAGFFFPRAYFYAYFFSKFIGRQTFFMDSFEGTEKIHRLQYNVLKF